MIKTIDIAGRKFNESVAEELNMSYSEAASLRRRIFESEHTDFSDGATQSVPVGKPTSEMEGKLEWSVFDAIREQIETLAREISLCLRYCSVTFRGLRPTTITLTGGEAYDQHLVNSLNKYLDCECVVGQPLLGIDLGSVEIGSDRRGELTEWSVAAGLALRGLQRKGESDIPSRISMKFPVVNRKDKTVSETDVEPVGSGVSGQENG